MHAGQAVIGKLILHNLYGVVAIDSDVADALFRELQDQMPDAGTVNLDADIIDLRISGGHLGQTLSIAKAYLHTERRIASKNLGEIIIGLWVQSINAPITVQGELLPWRDAALPTDKAADAPREILFGRNHISIMREYCAQGGLCRPGKKSEKHAVYWR